MASGVRGALAAAVTPFLDDQRVDDQAIAEVTEFYAASELDGLLVLGTTGEGVLLSVEERRQVAAGYIGSAAGRLAVVVHCGAQSTRDTVALAEHAVQAGADGVAVIPPPYYALDDAGLLEHMLAAARACAPAPFYMYEFAARSGYSIPVTVVLELRERAPNLTGLKVSDSPFDQVQPYLIEGLDVFIGAEGLIHDGLKAGTAGAVSGLAAALPELTVSAVRDGTREASVAAAQVRTELQRWPFQSALKAVLRARGLAVTPAVRGPLRRLADHEVAALRQWMRQNTAVSTVVEASWNRSTRSGDRSNVVQR